MSEFQYRGGQLFAEDVALSDIAGRYGTPSYVYSRAALERPFLAYRDALAGCDHLVCYAVKANGNLAVLDILARLGAGFDIVSGGELQRVIAAGGDPRKVVFSGVGKSRQELALALEQDIFCFNIESATELENLHQVATANGATARISVRINPDVDADTHSYIATGQHGHKFGMETAAALALYRRAADLEHIDVAGADFHIGSQLTRLTPFLDALRSLLALVERLADQGIGLRHINVGGGLGVRYRDETPPTIAEYIAALRDTIGGRQLTLLLEPGRSISAEAGILLTRVNDLKQQAEHNFAIVDAAMNDLLRPALYGAWQDIVPVQQHSGLTAQCYDVVGPVCETGDFLGRQRQLAIRQGDLLAVLAAGAYGYVMSSNYNTRPRAAELVVDAAELHLVRPRETVNSLFRGEQVLPERDQ